MVISDDDFMVIARLESLIAGAGLEDALERAEQYIQAGADGLMVHSPVTGGPTTFWPSRRPTRHCAAAWAAGRC